jgi:two-component system cell cycle response regulator
VKRLRKARTVALALVAPAVALAFSILLRDPRDADALGVTEAGTLALAAAIFCFGAVAFAGGRWSGSAVASLHDPLTNLRSRHGLLDDLDELQRPATLLLFDLDGFKRYNDTFGHAAGDALLARLGRRLADCVAPRGTAYRLDGDEFAVVTAATGEADAVAAEAAEALSEHGEGFAVTCSFAAAELPHEARDGRDALRLADRRLYAVKQNRVPSASRQSCDVLLQALSERYPSPHAQAQFYGVADVASAVAENLCVTAEDLVHIRLAAELHDIGKIAIPDAILQKPGELDESEWEFVRQHPLVGERIIAAAPALREAARLVRSSHERWDGSGYPDGLAGEDIPLGSRIIAICDAFNAMIGARPYRRGISEEMALEQLRRCAGTQFDPELVRVFFAVHAERRVGAPLKLSA